MTRVGAKTLLRLALVDVLVPLAIVRSRECYYALCAAERSIALMADLVALTRLATYGRGGIVGLAVS